MNNPTVRLGFRQWEALEALALADRDGVTPATTAEVRRYVGCSQKWETNVRDRLAACWGKGLCEDQGHPKNRAWHGWALTLAGRAYVTARQDRDRAAKQRRERQWAAAAAQREAAMAAQEEQSKARELERAVERAVATWTAAITPESQLSSRFIAHAAPTPSDALGVPAGLSYLGETRANKPVFRRESDGRLVVRNKRGELQEFSGTPPRLPFDAQKEVVL